MSTVELKQLKGEASTFLCHYEAGGVQKWAYCDRAGAVQIFDSRSKAWETVEAAAGKEITAFAISPSGGQCAIAYDNALHIHAFPTVQTIVLSTVLRFTLPITKIAFDNSGDYM
jgi:hypothetical protein